MSVLLHIDSSPLSAEGSISRHLSHEFVQSWKQAHPDGEVITRDVTSSNLPIIDAEWIGASFTPAAARTDAQREVLAFSDLLIAELRAADEYIIGAPMHNFTLTASLRLWIDQISRAGETFTYSEEGANGLLKNKKATFIVTSGAVYDEGTAMASYNFVAPYLRAVFGFLGVTDTTIYMAGGVAQTRYGKLDRDTFLRTHVEAIQAGFQMASV